MPRSKTLCLPAPVLLAALLPLALGLGESRAAPQKVAEAPSVVYVGPEAAHLPYLGVKVEEETEYSEGGARVTQVVDESPAEKAGIEVGDIIVGFDGKPIRGPVAMTKQLHTRQPGDKIKLTIVRDGRERKLEAELADRTESWRAYSVAVEPIEGLGIVAPEIDERVRERLERIQGFSTPHVFARGDCEEDEDCGVFGLYLGQRPRLGVELVETTPELNEHLGNPDGTGVLVSKVLRGLPAEHAGIQVGDLIVGVGGESIAGVSDLRRALRERAGESFEIELIRDGSRVEVGVTLPEPDDEEAKGPRAHYLRAPRAPERAAPAPPAPAALPAPPRPAPVARRRITLL